ncbi:MAG: MFS transporter [Lysobacteraceae bacterium]
MSPTALPPPSPLQRWTALVLVSLAMFGNYYLYDALGPVVDLMRSQLGFSHSQVGWLYTAYSIAALLVLLAGGWFIDRFGTRLALVVFAVVCVIAAAMTALGPDFETIVAGRFLLGLGAEPMIVAAVTVLARWFKGSDLSFAFGLNLSISRLGSASADWSTGFAAPLYSNWQDPLWLATAIGGVAVAAAMLYWMHERRVEGRAHLGERAPPDELKFSQIFRFPRTYWTIVALCVVFYATVFPFRGFAINYFQQAHGLDRESAGALSSLLPMAAIVATPIFGLIVDRVGKRSLFMAAGSLLMLPLFLAVTYLPPGPLVGLPGGAEVPLTLLVCIGLFGLVFSLIPAVLWHSVPQLVDEERLGSAYAMMTFCQQVGMAAVPLVIGTLNDWAGASPENPAGYTPGMWFYTALGACGLGFSWHLWWSGRGPSPAHALDRPPIR